MKMPGTGGRVALAGVRAGTGIAGGIFAGVLLDSGCLTLPDLPLLVLARSSSIEC